MAIATSPRVTPEDLLNIEDRPMPELVDGELQERELGQDADSIAANLLGFLWLFLRTNPLGLLNGAQGSYRAFPDDPDKVRIPALSFTRRERIPKDGRAKGHARVALDLVVEVVSPNDTVTKLNAKINDFLAAGVPLVWVAYPETRTVQVLRSDGTGRLLKIGDILEGEDVLPGFRCEVAEIFA